MTEHRRNQWTLALAALLVAAFVAQGWAFIRANSQTFDEAVVLAAGYSHLTTGDFRLLGEHPPLVKLLAALAVYLRYRLRFEPDPRDWAMDGINADTALWRIGDAFVNQGPVAAHDIIIVGRLPNLVLGACLLILIGWWAYRLWGRGAAVVAMAVAAFDPLLIAHSCVITTDVAVTLFSFVTLFQLWRFVERPTGWRLTAVGLSLGLVAVSKFSALLVALIVFACIGVFVLSGGRFAVGAKDGDVSLRDRIVEAIAPALRIAAIAIVVILPFYFFQGFSSWATGLKSQMKQQESPTLAFFLGEYAAHGWWYYFPTAFAIKTPIGTLALLAAALVTIRIGQPLRRREFVFVLLPAALYALALTQLKLNIGLRYALPIYPLLFLTIGHLATLGANRDPPVGRISDPAEGGVAESNAVLPRPGRRPGLRAALTTALVGVPLLATAASSLSQAPNQLAYFNELVGGPARGRYYLGDSNLDWGQGLIGLKEYLDRDPNAVTYLSYYGTARPAAYDIRARYLPGFGQIDTVDDPRPVAGRELLAISVTCLHALHDTDLAGMTPIAEIGHSILIYDLTGDRDAPAKLKTLSERLIKANAGNRN